MPSNSFDAILNQAINDIIENGFDSQERIDRWLRRLRDAAENSMVSATSLEQHLRDALAARYHKLVDGGELLRLNQGIDRFTLERIKPSLRAELDRRIMASAQLIKLNRSQAIDKTLQRFSGWSTSIPKGGVSAESKREVRKNQRKALASLPYEERRVLIDQGHKLVSAINEIVASDGGAIAGRWRSHWRQAGYNYREDHKERDEVVYMVRGSWADRAGLVKKGGSLYYDEITAAGQEPFCRCYMTWLYNLRDLPDEMITAKGRKALAQARSKADASARTDAVIRPTELDLGMDAGIVEAIRVAAALDRMGFSRGLSSVRMVPDRDRWHAQYDDGADVIEIQQKFTRLSLGDMVETLLHEFGHRGQAEEPKLFARFRRAHLDRMSSFVEIANPVHLEDLRQTGKVDGGLASEVFAESYGRAMSGRTAPAELLLYWRKLVAARNRLRAPADVGYAPVWRLRQTRCQRCSMFLPLGPGAAGNACTAVAGEISAFGHCELFETASSADTRPAVGGEATLLRIERVRAILA